jgi:hypothetical protein
MRSGAVNRRACPTKRDTEIGLFPKPSKVPLFSILEGVYSVLELARRRCQPGMVSPAKQAHMPNSMTVTVDLLFDRILASFLLNCFS